MDDKNNRYSKPKNKKLNCQLKVYVTADDEIVLKQKAEVLGLSFSSYARALLLGNKIHTDPVELRRIRFEINKIGVNLNQLIQNLHKPDQLPLSWSIDSLKKELLLVLEEL